LWDHAVASSGMWPLGHNRHANTVTREQRPNRTGVVRALALSAHWRWGSRPRGARAFSKVTSPDQRLTTQCRTCSGVACRSVQKKAASDNWPWGSRTKTKRIATGAKPGVYPSAVREKTQSRLRSPRSQSTLVSCHGVSERAAQTLRLRCRFPWVGLRPRWPGGGGTGG
jgi:hypothetical protein